MSKIVKNMISEDLKKRLTGVDNALLVNVIGMGVNDSNRLRKELISKNVKIMVVKNSLARRATVDTPLAPLFAGSIEGSVAMCWGSQDIVSLAKEIVRVSKDKMYSKMEILGGILDGEVFAAEKVVDISKWPSREEQISILMGQIIGVGAKLSSQLLAGGANLASQIKQISEKEEEAAAAADDTAA